MFENEILIYKTFINSSHNRLLNEKNLFLNQMWSNFGNSETALNE